MAVSDLNISNKEELLFPVDSELPTIVEQLTVCNVGNTPITLSFFKLFREFSDVRYYVIRSILVDISETFVLEDLRIDINQEFYIGVSGGSCSVTTAYFK